MIGALTKDLDPNDPIVAKVRAAPAKITHNVENAIACRPTPAARAPRAELDQTRREAPAIVH